MKRKSQPTYWGTAEATSKGVLKDLLDDDPEYPMYSYIEELDTYLAGVADGPWLVCLDCQTRQLVSKRGRRVLGVFEGPLAEGTAAYVAEVNPRKIRKLIKDIVRLKKAYEDQGFLLALALDERDQLAVRLTKGGVAK
jgi:hypothetical protein